MTTRWTCGTKSNTMIKLLSLFSFLYLCCLRGGAVLDAVAFFGVFEKICVYVCVHLYEFISTMCRQMPEGAGDTGGWLVF